MIRDAIVNENNFVSIFSDAVVLYEATLVCDDKILKNALIKSSILSVNYAIEAAANSFLQSVKVGKKLKDKLDKFSTLEKFDFVLQWHTEQQLKHDDNRVHMIRNLIANRNNMVHPKVIPTKVTVETTTLPDGRIKHDVRKPLTVKGQDSNSKLLGLDPDFYTEADAKEALISLTSFLNAFIEEWWEIDREEADLFLFQTWDGSLKGRPIMVAEHQITPLIRNNSFLDIRFIGIFGMF